MKRYAAAALLLLAGCGESAEDPAAAPTSEEASSEPAEEAEPVEEDKPPLAVVYDDCSEKLGGAQKVYGDPNSGRFHAQLADAGRTIIIPGVGQNEPLDERSNALESMECILQEADATAAVQERIGTTRALDGMQEADFGQFSAFWTYHPDDGLNLTIEDVGS